ncbi:DNA (cytosine-5-)-methyltransferase [Streptomyces fenghuangensis]
MGSLEKGKYAVPLKRSDRLELLPRPGSCERDSFKEWAKKQAEARPLAVDLFSGAGGLSLGLERAGWTVAAAVDVDKRALETHAHNFPGLSLELDLGDPAGRDELVRLMDGVTIDLVAGGPPCQPFSRAGRSKIRSLVKEGKRDPNDLRRELWRAYLDIVTRLKPRAVLMENVPDMGLGDDFFVIRHMEEELERAGYATQVRLVDAWRYGVPQHRKRLILLARNDTDVFTWREPDPKQTVLRDAIGDLPVLEDGDMGGRERDYRQPRNISAFARRMREGAKKGKIWDHMTRAVRPDDKVIFALMDSTMLYSNIPKEYQRYDTKHFTDKYKKLAWDGLSRTITAHIAKDGYWYIHPEQLRTLTVREAARIQTFPDTFRFAGTRSDAFRQIGNAVPPFLGEAAAQALRKTDEGRGISEDLTPHWLTVRKELADWAEQERGSGAWYHLPGDPPNHLHAAVTVALGNALRPGSAGAKLMGRLRGVTRLGPETYDTLVKGAPSARSSRSLERLKVLVDNETVWEKPLELPEVVGFEPAEAALYRLLSGEDLLLAGQGPIRVAARVNGTEADRKNRLSDGRVNLAKLVGAREEAPLRMAALRLIGMTTCRERAPLCSRCPLREYCAWRKSAEGADNAVDASDTEQTPLF